MKGLYILSGSSAPKYSSDIHSGAMRISKMTLRTMSLFELGISSKEVNFRELFNSNYKISGAGPYDRNKTIDLIIKGG
jgi:hypothetical protein